ncbi:MAG: hypothetical protein GY832_46180 [Chloroflexi bacterium]|nr:hypothetical protein [Chloroflexota bacterium]
MRKIGDGTLHTINNSDGDGNYIITWDVDGRATSYILQETSGCAFINWRDVYTGSNTAHTTNDMGAARYYYRVKARNSWGDSNWSNEESVHVMWEAEDNDTTLDVNGPLCSGLEYYGYPDDREDYFSIYLETGGDITIDLTDHTGQGVQLQLHYQSVPNMVEWAWHSPYHIEHAGSAGWYYIRIFTESGYNNVTPYTLQVTFP